MAVTELDSVAATLAAAGERVIQSQTALRAAHARYKVKCAEVAALRSENDRLRREVQHWRHLMRAHAEIISLAECVIQQQAGQ